MQAAAVRQGYISCDSPETLSARACDLRSTVSNDDTYNKQTSRVSSGSPKLLSLRLALWHLSKTFEIEIRDVFKIWITFSIWPALQGREQLFKSADQTAGTRCRRWKIESRKSPQKTRGNRKRALVMTKRLRLSLPLEKPRLFPTVPNNGQHPQQIQ